MNVIMLTIALTCFGMFTPTLRKDPTYQTLLRLRMPNRGD